MSQATAARVFGVSCQSVNGWDRRRSEGGAGAPVAAAGSVAGAVLAALPSGDPGAAGQRPLSGSAEAAVRPLNPRGRAAVHRPAIQHSSLAADGGTVPAALGFHAAEAPASRLRASPRSRAPLAEEAVPGDPGVGPTGGGHGPLERRGGDPLRPPGRALLGPARPDPIDPRPREAHALQHDPGGHQPGGSWHSEGSTRTSPRRC